MNRHVKTSTPIQKTAIRWAKRNLPEFALGSWQAFRTSLCAELGRLSMVCDLGGLGRQMHRPRLSIRPFRLLPRTKQSCPKVSGDWRMVT